MLKILEIEINDIGPIESFTLKFNTGVNIICGKNGIGKTTILECIAQTFAATSSTLKKTVGKNTGKWRSKVLSNNNVIDCQITIDHYLPTSTQLSRAHGLSTLAKEIIVFKTAREIGYQRVASISNDPEKSQNDISNQAIHGVHPADVKSWFLNRHLWSKHEDHLSETQIKNYKLAIECFSLLSSDISFSKLDKHTNDILLNTPNGEILFEYLSSGYKSCLAILLSLIKEIEYRFRDPGVFTPDFDGIIIIDELDLHLHPEFQAKIYTSLKSILPNAQIIISTHSPHIIQVASAHEIIALTIDELRNIKINTIVNNKYGCQGWTLEEVLEDVMGISETRTDLYLESVGGFNAAMDQEDYDKAKQYFEILDEMLHPESSLRKILRIQLAGLSNND